MSLLAYWYSHQRVCVQWRTTLSSSFAIGNGTTQGGVLSPCLFNYYARELILTIMFTNVECNVGGVCTNIFAYADDIVLLAPSWRALQYLIDVLQIVQIALICNVILIRRCVYFHLRINENL